MTVFSTALCDATATVDRSAYILLRINENFQSHKTANIEMSCCIIYNLYFRCIICVITFLLIHFSFPAVEIAHSRSLNMSDVDTTGDRT